MTNVICIVCPKGCHLSVDEENDYAVTGFGCERGREYGKKELPKEEDRKEPDFDGWVAGLKTEVEQELASAREALMALCETLKWIETKDRYSHALFSVLGADAYSYLEKEIKEKISRVQKEFGIPHVKND